MSAPVNDRLFAELLAPVAEWFYETAKALADLPVGDDTRTERVRMLERLDTLEEVGDLVAETLLVPPPEWETMRELAVGSDR